ncbi:MAG TPA: DNA replication and repair protein RecF, partial [Dongiaceae bacterium]|nr:DNA replication and repair protein RecF [Dongiaceae bacterium]
EVTIITGANGSGKTSLLEAIYLSLQGTSFKGSDADMLQKDGPWWRIDILLDDLQPRTIKFDPLKATSRKQFVIDGKTTARIPAKQKYPVVLFEPEDLRLLHGSPARRRQFIDRFISQLNPLYGPTLRKYERALKQRNNLLKKPYISDDELFAWNIALAEHGAFIIEQRIAFIEQINHDLASLYQEIAGTHDDVSVHYSHTFVGDIKQKLLNELHAHLERDRYLGNTSVGPHRHDVMFEINNSPALSVASRGEARTIVLALKFLEVAIIEQLIEKQPIILLDDVFSELDATRQQLLTSQLKGHQIIITSATSHAGKHLHHVELG